MDAIASQPTLLADLLASYSVAPAKKRGSERGELLQYFLDLVNPGRVTSGYKAYTPARMGFLLSHLSTQDLYAFKSMCEDRIRTGYNVSKFFHGALKEQPWRD